MKRTLLTVSLIAAASAASAAPQLARVRGTVVSATDTSILVKTRDGATQTVTLAPTTKIVSVVKSSLDNVSDGKFIGTATKGSNPPVALEVVIFPASMKGTGEGHYDWDTINDTTASKGLTKSAMTNGTIKSASGAGTLTKSAMTNGTVKAGSGTGGGKHITVSYNNGQQLDVTVPPSAPIVEFVPADKSVVAPGAPIFANTTKDGDTLTARLVGIGKDGVVPPM
jgi:hypothetical protein